MKPDVVVDVGNTRIKWGRCRAGQVDTVQAVPHEAPDVWTGVLRDWALPVGSLWVLTGVHPRSRDALADWLRQRGEQVRVVVYARELPLRVDLEIPDYAGIDRLLDAVAVNSRRRSDVPAMIIDAGSAVTVDLLDGNGTFQGGAILPGLRLMAKSLHDYTALLPLIDLPPAVPAYPGVHTRAAMEVGIFWAVAGGIQGLIDSYRKSSLIEPEIYLSGGDTELLARGLPGVIPWPTMTLEGIRLTAEALS